MNRLNPVRPSITSSRHERERFPFGAWNCFRRIKKRNRSHDAQQKQEIPRSSHAQWFQLRLINEDVQGRFLLDDDFVPDVVDRQEDTRCEEPFGPEGEGPLEGHAAQISQEERGITNWQEAAADVADKEDEEHHRVHNVFAFAVGFQERPDQEHACAGGADETCDEGANGDEAQVDFRSCAQVSGDRDSPGDHVQREEQDDEGDVFRWDGVFHRQRCALPSVGEAVVDEGEPSGSHRYSEPVDVALPPVRR